MAVMAAPRRKEDWSAAELQTLRGMSIDTLGSPPADLSNRVADDARAAQLGQRLFGDARMSANKRVSCASCHDPAAGFTDRFATGHGMAVGTRRTMPIAPAIYSAWQFWDGRADSLWAQALGPIENPGEHGSTRGQVADLVARHYRRDYERVFGQMPIKPVGRASPLGNAEARRNWGLLPLERKRAIDTVFANVAKAIAAFERTQRLPGTRFDRYVAWLLDGQKGPSPLTPSETVGLRIFVGKGRCSTCHSGPLFSNGEFANTGVSDRRLDDGRTSAIAKALADPFNCRGMFNDAVARRCEELDFVASGSAELVGAFKVPSLRGVALRPPYMHAGQLSSLDAVIRHYERASPARLGRSQLKPFDLDDKERRGLLAFLATLDPAVNVGRPSKVIGKPSVHPPHQPRGGGGRNATSAKSLS